CQVNAVFRYIVENFKYYSDPRRDEFVQTPSETERIRGGDCEDLTILLNTYLENLGIETYVVLTDTHAYSLACGVDTQKLFEYSLDSLSRLAAEELGKAQEAEIVMMNGRFYLIDEKSMTFSLGPGSSYYYGGDGSHLEPPYEAMTIGYIVTSTEPLDIYFVPTRDDFNLLSEGKTFSHYPPCQRQNILGRRVFRTGPDGRDCPGEQRPLQGGHRVPGPDLLLQADLL
ncbi:MAG: transglutaminase domain-containing protein, partial [Euryarchaeota archaeon]|nr:transglutaminase domain-containing protein [Euryarchaeota archaeon]